MKKKKKNVILKITFYYITEQTKQKGDNMKYRKATKPKQDRKIFHETAGKTKKINVSPKTMRGGIRL